MENGVPHLRDSFIAAKVGNFSGRENPEAIDPEKRIVLRTIAHLSRDKAAPKMGHPPVCVGRCDLLFVRGMISMRVEL